MWQHYFDVDLHWNRIFDTLKFDAASSRLVVGSEKTIFVLSPPCLLDEDKLMFECVSLDVKATSDSLGSNLAPYRGLLPKCILFDLLRKFTPSDIRGSLLDVADASFSSDVAFMIHTRELLVYVSRFEQVFSSCLKDFFHKIERKNLPRKVKRIPVKRELTHRSFLHKNFSYIFLYPKRPFMDVGCVLFHLEKAVLSIFICLDHKKKQQKIEFKDGRWFGMKQTKDGGRVTCLGENGVLVIDLSARWVLREVSYCFNLRDLLHSFQSCFRCFRRPIYMSGATEDDSPNVRMKLSSLFKSHGLCDISDDGKMILLGWNIKSKKRMVLTSQMANEEVAGLQNQAKDTVPCWAFGEDLNRLVYLDVFGNDRDVNAICLNGHEGKPRSFCLILLILCPLRTSFEDNFSR